ncbi:hypothetical protein Rm378p039 [Rhodothermus phage RM378]|uniref:hypothetical protein n=1 Tax=Rhodothermus phage RM378 TaxID=148943 RepID=UPI00000381CC|nr:hypothetical protein Rm378p039 [Rhodothermus phage RM378]
MTYREARALFNKIKTLPDYRNRVVIRMSEIRERPTFNPRGQYNTTPPGTYAYPLGFVLDIGGGGEDFVDFIAGIMLLPYASHAEWVHIFYIKDMGCFLNLGDKEDTEEFLRKYAEKNPFINTLIEHIRIYQPINDNTLFPILNRYLVGMPYENISSEEFHQSFNRVLEKLKEGYIDIFKGVYQHITPDDAPAVAFVNEFRDFISNLGDYHTGKNILEVAIARIVFAVFRRHELIEMIEAMIGNAPGEITSSRFINYLPVSDSRSLSAFTRWFAITHRLFYYAFNKGVIREQYLEESATLFVDMIFTIAFSKEKIRAAMDTMFRMLIDQIKDKGIPKSYRVYSELGYCGIYDPGTGGVHEAEPAQVVWWDPSVVEYYGAIPNIGMRERKIQNLKDYITALDVVRFFVKVFIYNKHLLTQEPRLFNQSAEDIAWHFKRIFYKKEFIYLFEKGLRMISRFIKTGNVNQLMSLIHDVLMLHLRTDLLARVSAVYRSYSLEDYYNEELKHMKRVVGDIADNMVALLTNYAVDILTGKEQVKDIDSAFSHYLDHLREKLQELLDKSALELRGKAGTKTLLQRSLAVESGIESILSGIIFMRKFLEAYDSDREKIEEAFRVVKERLRD